MDLSVSAALPTALQLLHAAAHQALGTLTGALAGFLGLIGGLRTVDRHNALEHPQRQRLAQWVQEEPGIHLRELATRLGTAVTNTQWHLRKLEKAGIVRTEKAHGRRLYYPTQGGQAAKASAMHRAARQNPNADRLLQFIAGHPGAHAALASAQLDMNPGTVRWHLRRLLEARLVRAIPEGAIVHYYADAAAQAPSLGHGPPHPVHAPGHGAAHPGHATGHTPAAGTRASSTP